MPGCRTCGHGSAYVETGESLIRPQEPCYHLVAHPSALQKNSSWLLFGLGIGVLFVSLSFGYWLWLPVAIALFWAAKTLQTNSVIATERFDILYENGFGYGNGEQPFQFSKVALVLPWLVRVEVQQTQQRRSWRTFWYDSYSQADWRRIRRIALNCKHANPSSES